MSDAKLTADIVIKFNKESLKFFNGLIKNTEKGLRTLERTSESVFANLGKVNKTAMNSAVAAGKAQVKLEKSVTQASEVVANSEKRIARATLETSKAIIQNARVLDKAKTERKESTKAIKEGAKVASKVSKEKSAAVKKESSEDAKLAARLRRVSREKAKLNKVTKEGTKASEKRGSQAKRTSKVFGEMANRVAQLRVVLGLAKFAANVAIKAFTIPAGVLTGWLTFLGISARGEREMAKMAKSVQVNTRFLKAFSMATKDAGLSADNAVDMLEEMSNKVGDGLETPTHGTAMAFRELGLNLKEVQKMSRQKGLTTIMDSIVKFRKAGGSDQQTVRLADEIFGGEGNKFAGYLLESKELFSDLIEQKKEFLASDLTSDRMSGFYKTLEITGRLIKEIKNEGLSEEFAVWQDVFEHLNTYLKENRDTIVKDIKEISKKVSDLASKIFKIFTNPENLKTFNSGLEITVGLIERLANGLERSLDIITKLRNDDVAGALKDAAGQQEGFSVFKTIQSLSNPASAAYNSISGLLRNESPAAAGNVSNSKNDNRKYNVYIRGDGSITQEEVDQIAEDIDGIEVY